MSEQWELSLSAADECLKANPRHKMGLGRKAVALLNLGRTQQAAAVAANALAIYPNDPYIHEIKGLTDLYIGRPGTAMNHLREALRIDPESESAKIRYDFARKVGSQGYEHTGRGRYVPRRARARWGWVFLVVVVTQVVGLIDKCSGPQQGGYSPAPQNMPNYEEYLKHLRDDVPQQLPTANSPTDNFPPASASPGDHSACKRSTGSERSTRHQAPNHKQATNPK